MISVVESLEQLNELSERNYLAVVKWHAPWCGWCVSYQAPFEAASRLNYGAESVVFCQADFSKVAYDKIKSLPTTTFHHKSKMVYLHVGLITTHELNAIILKVLEGLEVSS